MRRPASYALFALLGVALLACAGFDMPLFLAVFVAFGWVLFLMRILPEVQIGWAGVATALACLAAFAVGLHAFLAWLVGQTGTTAEGTPRRWSPRWTGGIVAVVVLTFVAGMATAGAAHQIGWLLTSKEPLFGSGGYTAARRAQSINNLKQIGLATLNYESSGGILPGPSFDSEGRPLHGVMTKILPYVEENGLYNAVNLSLPWDDPRNAVPFRRVVHSYINPGALRMRSLDEERDAAGYALGHYAGNARMVDVRSLKEVRDGTGQTILAGEVAGDFRAWGDPVNWRDPARGINRAPDGFGSPFKGGASILFLDGSVRVLKDTVDPKVVEALGTPAGGEAVTPGNY